MRTLIVFTEEDWKPVDGRFEITVARRPWARKVADVTVMRRNGDNLERTDVGVRLGEKDRTITLTADLVFNGEVWI
jgi:hypothetical protein